MFKCILQFLKFIFYFNAIEFYKLLASVDLFVTLTKQNLSY